MTSLTPTQWSVSKLVESFERGDLAIPEIQRDLVWDSDQVKELVNSIFEDFPCGSLIIWEPRLRDEDLMRQIIRPERLDYYGDRLPKYFLIDGQQRVTALASVMLEHGFIRKVEPELEEDLTSLFVNLKRFPQDLEAGSDQGDYNFPWVLMNDVLTGRVKDQQNYKDKLTGQQKTDIDRKVQRFRDYSFPVQIVQDTDYPTVGRVFALVNSQGTQLTGAEIYIASIIPHWRGISRNFRDYLRELRRSGYELDLTLLMRAITVIECKVPQIKKLADKVSKGQLSSVKLNQLWIQSRRSIDQVIRVLRKDLFLDKTKFFTSKNALVPLIYYVAQSDGKYLDRKAMMKFFLASQLGGHYSGAGETVLRRDLRYISETGLKAKQGLRDLLDNVVREAKQEYPGLKIKWENVEGVPSKNVMVLLMYIVTRRAGATDFGLGNVASLSQIPSGETQLHHIFPFDFMMKDPEALDFQKKKGLTPREYREWVNDVANLTFLSQAKNGEIGSDSPWQYLENETTPAMRRAHFIPEDKDLWKPSKFDEFLGQRSWLLARAMNSLISSLS